MRISALADDIDADLRDVYQSAFAILFFGTPHRGSDWTDAGKIARKFASALGFSTTQYNLQALQGNTEILEILRDDFARMLGKEAFHITSFQESYGLKGVKGLNTKVHSPVSTGNPYADMSSRSLSQIRLVLITSLNARYPSTLII